MRHRARAAATVWHGIAAHRGVDAQNVTRPQRRHPSIHSCATNESASMSSGPSFGGMAIAPAPRPSLGDMDATPKCVYSVPQRLDAPRFSRAMQRGAVARCSRACVVIVPHTGRNLDFPWLFLARLAIDLARRESENMADPAWGATAI
jgi:hypothetical protein